MSKSKEPVIQQHHISYNPDERVKIFKGEHWALHQIMRRKNISRGFLTALKVFIALRENDSKEIK